jgi:chromosome segregation ATPase
MIFLIGKIFVYMLLAGVVGAAAGWLFRNLQAQRTEESASRAVHDAKSKVPQIESLLRGRDEQILKLKGHLQETKSGLAERDQNLRTLEHQLREQEQLAKRWQQSAEAKKPVDGDSFDLVESESSGSTDTDQLIAELSSEIARLKVELAKSAATPALDEGDETFLQVEVEAMRLELQKIQSNLEVTSTDLVNEQRKVHELERERELQNKSLQALHQQLELVRTRRVANG